MKIRYLPLVTALLLAGCWHQGLRSSQDEQLLEVTENYYNLLMWKYYDRCAEFVRASDREDFEQFATRYGESLNITGYRVKDIAFSEDGDEASVSIQMTYYFYPSVTENTILLVDTWSKEGSMWFVAEPKYEEKFSAESP